MPRHRACLEDFTIGWICALHIELAAVISVLDEEYERIADVAQYTLGRIGQHGVVAICLPAGQLGTSAAAAVAVHMQRTFPALQYGLMVGIAGGVPSRNTDIRLGDVVVSHPQGRYGGVLQYDFGKTGFGGQQLPHGSLNSPHPILLQAVGTMRAVSIDGYDINAIMSSLKYPNLFIRPVTETDCLFEASYDHVPGDTCGHCVEDRMVQRTPRTNQNTVIHYGTVASGNQVIKDGSTRDRISAEHGGVLCFEMEAAGLMNIFPCLIVRGICDYADSHKNKEWQPFAAAAAAVCAKTVLSFVPSASRTTDGEWDILSHVSTNRMPKENPQPDIRASPGLPNMSPSAVRKGPNSSSLYLESTLTATDLDSYHKSLRFGEIDARHATIHDAHSETCRWLLERQEYQDWLAGENLMEHHGFFWIKGHPGTGKFTIMKFALKHAIREHTQSTVIKFFFNARGNELEKSVLGMYRSLLFQLLDKFPDLQHVFALHCSKLSEDEVPPTWHVDIVQSLFGHAVQRLGIRPLVCFIDALDECEEDQIRAMIAFFEHLGDTAASYGLNFRTCFSSRHYPNITIEHGITLILENQQGHSDDITKYVNSKLKGEGKLMQHVRNMICARSSGIFLWVVLVVQILRKDIDRGRMKFVERRLEEIPDGTDELFDDILTRDNEDVDKLIPCLQWILFAQRPLKAIELFYGVTAATDPDLIVEHESSYVDGDFLQRFLLNSSKGLAGLTNHMKTVQFIHESVHEYLLKATCPSIFTRELASNFIGISQERLKICCETYINTIGSKIYRNWRETFQTSNAWLNRDNHPFLDYAENNILHHADEAAGCGLNQEEFVGRFAELFTYFSPTARESYAGGYGSQNRSVRSLYVFANGGFANLVRFEVERVHLIDIEGGRHGSPIHAAIVRKCEKTLHALLTRSNDSENATLGKALHVTSRQREIAIQEVSRAYLRKERTLLCWAAEHSKIDLVKILLQTHKINLDARDNCLQDGFRLESGHGRTALGWASSNGNATIANLLLMTGQVNIESKDDFGRTALSSAARKGHETVVKLLLEVIGIDIESRCEAGRTPLSYAAGNGHEAVVVLLLATGKVDLESNDSDGGTPLSWAATNGHARVLKLLYGYWKSNMDRQGRTLDTTRLGFHTDNCVGETPLHGAVLVNAIEVVEFLLSMAEVDLEATNDMGETALDIAQRKGFVILIELLLQAKRNRAR